MKTWFIPLLLVMSVAARQHDRCCKTVCAMHDPGMRSACVRDEMARVVSGEVEDKLTPQYVPGGDWGAILYPSIDLSQLTSQDLLLGGVSESTVNTYSPLLSGGDFFSGLGVGDLLQDLVQGELTLQQPEADLFCEVFTTTKMHKTEAYYNMAVNKRGWGTCFVDLPRYEKNYLVGAAWPMKKAYNPEAIEYALQGNWSEVKNLMTTASHGMFADPYAVLNFVESGDHNVVDCDAPVKPTAFPPPPPPGISFPFNHPCHEGTLHLILDEEFRSVDRERGRNCDMGKIDEASWYRVQLSTGENALAESCPPINRCGTVNALYMTTAHPTAVGVIEKRIVSSRFNEFCDQIGFYQIKVVRCPQFFLYQLWEPNACTQGYCADNIA